MEKQEGRDVDRILTNCARNHRSRPHQTQRSSPKTVIKPARSVTVDVEACASEPHSCHWTPHRRWSSPPARSPGGDPSGRGCATGDDHVRAWEQARHPAAHGLSDSKTAREVVVIDLQPCPPALRAARLLHLRIQRTADGLHGLRLAIAPGCRRGGARSTPLHPPPADGIGGKAEAGSATD